MQVAAYCRVSTDRGEQAASFASQQRFFREYVAAQPEWELTEIYADEGVSGTSMAQRQSFLRMLDDARSGRFSLLLTKEVSRFSRNILDTIGCTRQLRGWGVGVIFLNDGIDTREQDAELRLSIMGSLAQEESRRISSRVKWGQSRRMEQGVVFGHALLGYRVQGGRLSIDEEGSETVQLIFRMYGNELRSCAAIARELEGRGLPTGSGGRRWSAGTVLKILKNEKYVGDLVQKKTVTPDYLSHKKEKNRGSEEFIVLRSHHEAIIDRALFEAVQARIEARRRGGGEGQADSGRSPFSGKIRCGECGAAFVSRPKYGKKGQITERWGCGRAQRDRTACGIGRMIRSEAAAALFRCAMRSLTADAVKEAGELAAAVRHCLRVNDSETQMRLQRSRQRLTRKREAVLDAYFSGKITEEERRTFCLRCEMELESAEARYARETQTDAAPRCEVGEAELEYEIRSVLQCEKSADTLIRFLLDSLTVYADGSVELRLKELPQRWVFGERKREPRAGGGAG